MNIRVYITYAAALLIFSPTTNPVFSAYCQTAKDTKTLSELERDIRRDLDKHIAKYRPIENRKAVANKPSESTWERPSLKSSYDKFKDITTVHITAPLYHVLSEPRLPSAGSLRGFIADIDIIATYSYSGQALKGPDAVTLIFKTFSDGAFFGTRPTFIVLADGKRLNFGYMEQSIRRFEKSAEEYESVNIPIDQFMQIVSADSVEAQIGQLDFPLGDLQLNALRSIVGLPARALPGAARVEQKGTETAGQDLTGSVWEGNDFALEFQRGGTAMLKLPRERPGAWSQAGDKVEMEFPYIDVGAVRGLAVGIIKDDKLVVKFKFFGLFGGSQVVEVFKRKQ
jgi:hypothetical protein